VTDNGNGSGNQFDRARRNFLRGLGLGGAAALAKPAWGGQTFGDAWAGFFQKHYQRMTKDEIEDALATASPLNARTRHRSRVSSSVTRSISVVARGTATVCMPA